MPQSDKLARLLALRSPLPPILSSYRIIRRASHVASLARFPLRRQKRSRTAPSRREKNLFRLHDLSRTKPSPYSVSNADGRMRDVCTREKGVESFVRLLVLDCFFFLQSCNESEGEPNKTKKKENRKTKRLVVEEIRIKLHTWDKHTNTYKHTVVDIMYLCLVPFLLTFPTGSILDFLNLPVPPFHTYHSAAVSRSIYLFTYLFTYLSIYLYSPPVC
jgi:hypothetical protein